MCPGHFCAWLLDYASVFAGGGECLVQRKSNSLNGDVVAARLLQERAKDAGGDIATAAYSNDKAWLKGRDDFRGRSLAELVYLLISIKMSAARGPRTTVKVKVKARRQVQRVA